MKLPEIVKYRPVVSRQRATVAAVTSISSAQASLPDPYRRVNLMREQGSVFAADVNRKNEIEHALQTEAFIWQWATP
jgi:hypothetical protein